MLGKAGTRVSDLRGVSRITLDAVAGVVGLVEAMHLNIASGPRILGAAKQGPTTGITGLVYRSIRGVIGVVGHGLDALLALLDRPGESSTWPSREALLAAAERRAGRPPGSQRQPAGDSDAAAAGRRAARSDDAGTRRGAPAAHGQDPRARCMGCA